MGNALGAIGKGIADLGAPDPRFDPSTGKHHTLLISFLKAMADDDDPATRAYPVRLTILQGMRNSLAVDHPEYGALQEHIIELPSHLLLPRQSHHPQRHVRHPCR